MKYYIASFICLLLMGAEKIDWSFSKPKEKKPLAATILNVKPKAEPKKVAPQNDAPQLGEPVVYFYQSLPVVTYPKQSTRTIYGTKALGPNCFR
jgi:hypothetical protein